MYKEAWHNKGNAFMNEGKYVDALNWLFLLMINYVLALIKLLNWIQSIKKHGITKELHLKIKVNTKMH